MKSKILKYIGLPIVGSAFLFAGCNDLELDTKAVVVSDTYYTDASTLEPAIIGIYGRVQRATWAIDNLSSYMGADDLTSRTGSNKAPVLEADQFARTDGNGWVTVFYNDYYTAIMDCNSFIEGASKRAGFIDEATLNNALANAYFIRGMLYFRLAVAFKNVPMPLSPKIDLTMKRTPYRNVMAQAISDLKYAEKWLVSPRDTDPTKKDGHATKIAAKAFLAKTYMQLTGYPTNETTYWDSVKIKTKEIIDNGTYSLMNDFAACFENPTQFNKEMIFSHVCEKGIFPLQAESRYYGYKWCDWGDTYMEHKYYNSFPAGYRRTFSAIGAADTANTPATDLRTKAFKVWVKDYKHPLVSKFSYGTIKGLPGFEHVWQSSNDCPAMRTSEVYLMYAEACARKGDVAEGAKYLNYVKRRAYAQGLKKQADVLALPNDFWKTDDATIDFAGGSADDLIEAILSERKYEFLGEIGGNRWLDLLRLEKVGDVNAYRIGKTVAETGEELMLGDPYDKKQWWTPIPGTEITLNPNLAE